MLEAINRIIDAILPPSDRIEVWTIGGTAIVAAKNRGSRPPAIRFISGHYTFAGC